VSRRQAVAGPRGLLDLLRRRAQEDPADRGILDGDAAEAPLACDLDGDSLRGLAAGDRRPALLAYLREEVARVAHTAGSRVAIAQPVLAMGLDSLATAELQSRVESDLGIAVSLAGLLAGATVGELADQILAGMEEVPDPRLPPPLRPVPRGTGLPLSYGQQRLWFLDQLEPGSAAYNMPAALSLEGDLDRSALGAALDRLRQRHETLRTTFRPNAGEPIQEVAAAVPVQLPVVDLAALPPARRQALAARLAAAEARRPFDLARGPLLRALLARLGGRVHLLLLTLHHSIADGWSMGVLLRDLSLLYDALAGGREPRLPELPVQYADYAVWQRRRVANGSFASDLRYWRRQLADRPAALALAFDGPPPAARSARGGTATATLPADLGAALGALGRRHGVTPFMLLLAAFEALLARTTQRERFLLGTPVANRTRPELQGLVGFFANTLVLAAEVLLDGCFGDLLARVREVAAAALAHQELPFELLVEALAPERTAAGQPLFEVMFVHQGAALERASLGALALRRVPADTGTCKFDLTLSTAETAGTIRLVLEHRYGLLSAPAAARLLGHLTVLLQAVAVDPGRRLDSLPLLTSAERHQLLVAWNDTGEGAGQRASLYGLFAAQARRTPEATAVVCEGQRLSYGALQHAASRLAAWLRAIGVGPESPVGICLDRSCEMVVAMLAVLQAGGAYLPLEPTQPRERLAAILATARVPALLTRERLLPALPPVEAALLCLEPGWESAAPAGLDAAPPLYGEALAYVVFTSGSSGRPKGVMVPQRGICNRLLSAVAAYGLGARDHTLQAFSFAFDASIPYFFQPLATGASVVLARPRAEQDPGYLVDLIAKQRVAVAGFSPSMLRVLVEHPRLERCRSLRYLLCGIDSMTPELARRFFERLDASLVFGYGPTEASVSVTRWVCSPGVAERVVPIGRPITGTRIYLLDPRLEPVPLGLPGELHIGNAPLARGYLGEPGLTASAMVPDPFSGLAGARLYKTGDLARYLPGGEIQFLGRIDHQVKVRGFRVELGEIEFALARHPAVGETVVTARDGPRGDKELVAYVVARGGRSTTPVELGRFLRERLPEYMVPVAFVSLPALPLAANGKVDRRALPAPKAAPAEAGAEPVAPRSPLEEILAQLVAEVLQRESVGVHDSFFELGGHSLLATRLVARLPGMLGIELPVRAVFEAPTVAELAERVWRAWQTEERPRLPAVSPAPRDAPLPLSPAQRGLWFFHQLEPQSALYNIPAAFRLQGRLAPVALAAALSEIARRHEALRTTFATIAGEPVQRIGAAAPLPLPLIDLGGLPEKERRRAAQELAAGAAARPFDLRRGPLLRASLARLGEEDHLFLLSLHHLIADGWSLGVLCRELSALYAALTAGGAAISRERERPAERAGDSQGGNGGSGLPAGAPAAGLPELPVQYADFAVWQRDWLCREGSLDSSLAYWRQRWAGMPAALELPTDRPRPMTQAFRGGALPLSLPAATAGELRRLARAQGATLFMGLLAAAAAVLQRYAGQPALAIGSPFANRARAEVEGLIGLFVNTLPLRVDSAPELSLAGLLGRVRESLLADYAHQEVPFEKLVEALQPVHDLARSPLFQVMLLVQPAPQTPPRLLGLTATAVPCHTGTAKFELTLSFAAAAGGLSGWIEFNRDLFDATTARRLAAHLRTWLAAALAAPRTPIAELPLLSPAESQQLLLEWSASADVAAHPGAVHELFELRAAERPDAPAVGGEDGWLSYGELERRAASLARALALRGVALETVVAVAMERSIELVVALLAVLKAGGAYLPLDPEDPRERLAFLLEDSGAALLLTQPSLVPPLAEAGVPVVAVDRGSAAGEAPAAPLGRVPAESLAYVIYTSGSTGRPKGVQIAHRPLVSVLGALAARLEITSADELLAVTAPSFDVAIAELLLPLTVGARVRIASREVAADGERLAEALARTEVTAMAATPATWRLLLAAGWRGRPGLKALCAGETLPRDLAERLLAASVALWNLYGPTETTIYATAARVLPGAPGSIGRPLANTRVQLLTREGAPPPVGVTGEIHIGGAGPARGYRGRPELTAARFVPDPFAGRWGEAGARLYKTGDLARYLPGGEIQFLGRIDHQVKVRGFRVELGEIEAVLARHPGVEAAVALAREDSPGERRLVAYVVARTGQSTAPGELRRFLRQRLPEYMVPAAWVRLPALPLTPGGKLDRRALPAPDPTNVTAASDRAFAAPRTPTERELAQLWKEALDPGRVGVHDNFFELGGNSLLAARLVARYREVFGVPIALRRLFEWQTLADLGRVIDRAREEAAALGPEPTPGSGPRPACRELEEAPPIAALPRAARRAGLPLSFAQERMWLLEQLDPGSPAFNSAAAFRLRGRLRPALLEAAWRAVIRRHEALRTTFHAAAEGPFQVVGVDGAYALAEVDLSRLAPEQRQREVDRLAAAEARRPFDLAAGPLLRTSLLRLGAEEGVLVLAVHHIVFDGGSAAILVRDLAAAYGALARGDTAALPEPRVQPADVAVWQRGWLRGEILARELAYWQQRLAGEPPRLALPCDFPRGRGARSSGLSGSHAVALAPELAWELGQVAQRLGGTLFMVLLAAFQALLARYAGEEDIWVGSPVADRDRAEIHDLIGLFINTLVLRTRLDGDPTAWDLLRRARETALGAFEHRGLPFEKLVEALRPGRGAVHAPLFQVLFALQNQPTPTLALPELTLAPVPLAHAATPFDLALVLSERQEGIAALVEYRRDRFEPATVARLAGHFGNLLGDLAAASSPGGGELRLSQLALLAPAEAHQLLREWNRGRGFAERRCVHELVAEQAARRPEAVALVGEQGELRYGELVARAGRLARSLRRLGVGPEVVVGLCIERSPAMVVGALAILQAGGAYLPLDPSGPPERLAFLLADSGVAVVLTEARRLASLPAEASGRALRRIPIDAVAEEAASPGEDECPAAGAAAPLADNLAYVIYTSGSTGRPKGSPISHRNVTRLLAATADLFGFGESDVWTLFHSLSFDFSVWELWGALASGGRLVVVPYWVSRSPEEFYRLLCRERVTVLNQTPAAFRQLARVEEGEQAGAAAGEPLALRLVLFGGEALDPASLAGWMARHGDERPRLFNLYGITETTVHATWRALSRDDVEGGGRSPIGAPLGDLSAHVLDRWGGLAPLGAAGELWVGGAGLARGYLGRPALTAERFAPDPFGAPGERLYRSGDLARRLPGGGLEYLGRLDDQVKVRGHRIEPGEVEAALAALPEVAEAAVLARGDDADSRRLVAYLVARPGVALPEAGELRRALARSLSEPMLPAAWVALAALPLTPHGKVDRRALAALPEPRSEWPPPGRVAAAPATPVAAELAGIWSSLLGIEEVGVHDNFFELGGHSLLFTQLASRVYAAFGVEVPLRVLFDAPTVDEMVVAVAARQLEELAAADEAGAAELLRELRALSPAEVEEQLAAEIAGSAARPCE
jgi:amino acid adenylation domain-containing protein